MSLTNSTEGMKTGYGVLPWWVLTAITILGAIPAVFMVDRGHIGDATKLDTEEADIEEEADTHDGYGAVKRVTSHRSTH